MRTIVYIDGFNFYYGAVKDGPYRWLDFSKMCQLLLPRNEIVRIKYFTARVSSRVDDPGQSTRQDPQGSIGGQPVPGGTHRCTGRFLETRGVAHPSATGGATVTWGAKVGME